MVKQLPFQGQILQQIKGVAQTNKEDLELKRKLLAHLEQPEMQFNETMQQFSANLSAIMSQGFAMMQCFLQQNQNRAHNEVWHNRNAKDMEKDVV